MATQKYRRKTSGIIVDAHQYGEGKPWTKEAMSKVAAFVTGVDVDNHTVVANEHVLDAVRPVLLEWDIDRGKTPIEVADGPGGRLFRVDLTDWIVKLPSNAHIFFKEWIFPLEFEAVYNVDGVYMSDEELAIQTLAEFILTECFEELEGTMYDALAKKTAQKVIKAGWFRKETS